MKYHLIKIFYLLLTTANGTTAFVSPVINILFSILNVTIVFLFHRKNVAI